MLEVSGKQSCKESGTADGVLAREVCVDTALLVSTAVEAVFVVQVGSGRNALYGQAAGLVEAVSVVLAGVSCDKCGIWSSVLVEAVSVVEVRTRSKASSRRTDINSKMLS